MIGACSEEDEPCAEGHTITITDPSSIEMNWVEVEGGTFDMGCTAEQVAVMTYCIEQEMPVHKVSLDGYMISKFEVTNQQFLLFLNSQEVDCINDRVKVAEKLYVSLTDNINFIDGLFTIEDSLKNHPITLYWSGANAFCEWVRGRLPTEAEWEFAARGGNKSKGYVYSGSNNFEEVGRITEDADSKYEIGSLAPNELGIFDMSGNASEWCNDFYEIYYYHESPEHNPQGPKDDSDGRSVRTGNSSEDPLHYGRVSYRSNISGIRTGCRCAKNL